MTEADRIAALEAAVATLRREVAELHHRHARRRRDSTDDAPFVSGIAGAYGRATFSAIDLHDSRDPILRAVLDGADVRMIGAWLKRLRGRAVGAYVVQRIGRDGDGALWTLHVSR